MFLRDFFGLEEMRGKKKIKKKKKTVRKLRLNMKCANELILIIVISSIVGYYLLLVLCPYEVRIEVKFHRK